MCSPAVRALRVARQCTYVYDREPAIITRPRRAVPQPLRTAPLRRTAKDDDGHFARATSVTTRVLGRVGWLKEKQLTSHPDFVFFQFPVGLLATATATAAAVVRRSSFVSRLSSFVFRVRASERFCDSRCTRGRYASRRFYVARTTFFYSGVS